MSGRPILILVFLAAISQTHPAVAEPDPMFRVRMGQLQENGDIVERGEWRCASDVLRKGKCAREVPVTIDGVLKPVLFGLHAETADANTTLKSAGLRITAAQAGKKVALESGKRKLGMDRQSRFAGEISLWETSGTAKAGVHDLVYRKPVRKLSTITLIIDPAN